MYVLHEIDGFIAMHPMGVAIAGMILAGIGGSLVSEAVQFKHKFIGGILCVSGIVMAGLSACHYLNSWM